MPCGAAPLFHFIVNPFRLKLSLVTLRIKYEKPPLTYQAQIELLKSRGVIFADEAKAIYQLSNVSYFRLSAYMFPFKKKTEGMIADEFRFGTTWKDI